MNDMTRTAIRLGGLGGILVLILGIINYFTTPLILEAQLGVEKRARKKVFAKVQFSPQTIYILEKKSGVYPILKEVANPSNFEELNKKTTIDFVILKEGEKLQITDRLNLKDDPLVIKPDVGEKLLERLNSKGIKPVTYNEAYDPSANNVLKGWVVKYYASGGYSGNIGLLIGYNVDKKVTGYLMVDHAETPGLGVKANEPDFVQPFIGKNPLELPTTKTDFKPKLKIDVISGATITSLAVSIGILEAFKILNVKKGDAKVSNSKNSSEKKEEKPNINQAKEGDPGDNKPAPVPQPAAKPAPAPVQQPKPAVPQPKPVQQPNQGQPDN